MQLKSLVFSLLSIAAVTLAAPAPGKPLVESNKLRRVLTRTNLLKHAARLTEFANSDPDRTRAFGSKGHQRTVDYIYDTFKKYPDYYTVEKQEFIWEYAFGTSTLSADGEAYSSQYFTYSPSTDGLLEAELVNVANLGCTDADFPAEVSGRVALVARGECEFGAKAVLAGKAGATGIIIYNNIPGDIQGGTFGAPVRPEGPYVPGVMISQEAGVALAADVAAGTVNVLMDVESVLENRVTHNVIAQTIGGDQNNVVASGGHTDSVGAGPGINDDGSGIIGILETAIQLTEYSVKNAVRWCFWSAEEFGLVGSDYYVTHLSVEEQNKIAVYLNFDMIASPNYAYFVYDGDGSGFNLTGPTGSAEIEHMFEDYYIDIGEMAIPTAFDGRSDYGPFLDANIASGGLFTGAEGIKTAEQAALYGGDAGVAYDINYHKAGDNFKNVDVGAWIQNTKAIAHAVATYARTLDSLPPRENAKVKREVTPEQKAHAHSSHCGHEALLL